MIETQHQVTCEPVEALLQWVAGELPQARADTVRAHVRACVHCQAILDVETDVANLRGCAHLSTTKGWCGDRPAQSWID